MTKFVRNIRFKKYLKTYTVSVVKYIVEKIKQRKKFIILYAFPFKYIAKPFY